jgi:RecA-family ATPase
VRGAAAEMTAAAAYESPTDRVLRALAGCGVKRAGDSKWSSRCPGHADTNPSLSIETGRNGGVVLNCHKGCEIAAILDAIGLTMQDLFADGGQRAGDSKPAPAGPPVYYTWCDAEGEPVDRKVRQPMSDGKKRMFWEHAEAGQWKSGQSPDDRRPPLYKLPELLAARSTEVIHVAEGEKCVETLRGLGLIATTTGGATSTLTPDAVSYFEGRKVVLWPDDDAEGAKHMATHQAALAAVTKSIKLIDRSSFRKYAKPGKGGGGDVADLVEDLRSDGLIAGQIRDRVLGLVPGSRLRSLAVNVTNEWLTNSLPPPEYLSTDRRTGMGAVDKTGTWLLAAPGGAGKGHLTLDLALAVATGGAWYDLATSGRPGRVLMIGAEDGATELRRRLKRIAERRYPGANIERRIVILPLRGQFFAFVAQDRITGSFGPGEGLRDVIAYVEEEREASGGAPFDLVGVDPISRIAGVCLDKDSAAATAFIDALDRLSAAAGGLVLAVAHTNKTSRAADKGAAESTDVRGSSGLSDGARGVIQLVPEVDKATKTPTGRVILSMTKGNHVARWADIILRRGDGGVLEPLDEVDRALFEAGRRGPSPQDRQAARDAEREARKDRDAAAALDREARRRAETRARKDAEAQAQIAADARKVCEIIATGFDGKLRDAVKAKLGCGSGRADLAIAAARAQQGDAGAPVPCLGDENPPTPPCAPEAPEAPGVPRAPVPSLRGALEAPEAPRGTGGTGQHQEDES